MSEINPPIKVQILGKEYPISCPPEEQHDLLMAARYLDEKMRQIRGTGRVIGSERIAVMAALNIAHELLATWRIKTSSQNSQGVHPAQSDDDSLSGAE